MLVRGKEVILGFVPKQNYTVLVHKAEEKVTAKGLPAVVLECEILSPETVEHAGKTYRTAGSTGIMYAMLKNKNGEDAALTQLVPTLEKLKLMDDIAEGQSYGRDELVPKLTDLALRKVRMSVTSQAIYDTESTEKNAQYDVKFARLDEKGEPIVAKYTTRFDFNNIVGFADDAAEVTDF